MKSPTTRLIDPHLAHERLAGREHGAKSPREIDEEARIATDLLGSRLTDRKRLTGSWADGSANRDFARIMETHGFLVDETDDNATDNAPYENNAGLLLRGTPPSIAINAVANITGTGGAVALNDATDNSGRITLTTGTGVSVAGLLATITFVRPKRNADYAVILSPRDANASWTAGFSVYSDFGTATTTAFTISNSVALASSTSYHWDYLIVERESI
jgi:hypothetical protein